MRIASPKKATGELGGWIHKLDEPLPVVTPKPVERKSLADVTKLANEMFNHPRANEHRTKLAEKLGVSVSSLEALLVGVWYDERGYEFASFPSRDERGRIIGIIRRYEGGKKLTVKGTSNSGVFAVLKWWTIPGPIYVVEGPTDVAACFDRNLAAIGRPSNTGGASLIDSMLSRRANDRKVIIVGENDMKPERRFNKGKCPDDCKGCAWCWPGKFGATSLARQLQHRSPSIIMPPDSVKDIRQWAKRGTFADELAKAETNFTRRQEGREKWFCRRSGQAFRVYSESEEIMSIAMTAQAAIDAAKEAAHELGYRVIIETESDEIPF